MPSEPNPYLAARGEFTSVFADLAKGKRNWQLTSFSLLVLLAMVLGAYLKISLEARITPYVIEVDRMGQAIAFGPAERLQKTDTRLYVFQLSLFIRNLRTVSSDFEAQKAFVFAAYAYVSGTARTTLDEYFLNPAHDPRVLGRTITRQVQVTSVLQVPNTDTWKLSWRETETPRFVGASRSTVWEAYLQVKHSPPRGTEALLLNPLGLYVTEINWTQQVATATGDAR